MNKMNKMNKPNSINPTKSIQKEENPTRNIISRRADFRRHIKCIQLTIIHHHSHNSFTVTTYILDTQLASQQNRVTKQQSLYFRLFSLFQLSIVLFCIQAKTIALCETACSACSLLCSCLNVRNQTINQSINQNRKSDILWRWVGWLVCWYSPPCYI